MRAFQKSFAAICLAAALAAGSVAAQEVQGAHLSIELNALEPVEDACRMSFLIQNGHTTDIEQAVYEAVLFDTDGQVNRMTLFDFGELPAARPRVRQFIISGLACAGLGRLLINGAETCSGEGIVPGACTKGLELRSRTDVEIIG
ncbi:hypothetical protein [Antarctobacter sp.]|uniref:hypothetical protein n=1 Tax=Antarctobacter sp. TaxID=1872577 RepID=UPI002B27A2EF|nr:hypothetical protein [Antarctobacter sp.]